MDSKTPSGKQAAARHALVVDDEPQVRLFIAKALGEAGFIPHEFSRVTEVEAAMTVFSPEIIVLDLSLGGSDGVEIMRSLAAARYRGKVLLVSGHDPSTLNEAHKIGERRGPSMLPALRKPFRVADLQARLALVRKTDAVTNARTDLESGLQNGWLELWYQPKVSLKTMAVCGAEALIRMRHPVHGVLPPAAFLPPPGDRLYKPLTDFVVRRACADWSTFAAWPSIGDEWASKRLAINVPASVLQSSEFIDNLRRHLPTHPKFPGLIVEIAEDEAISDPEVAREIAIQLKLYNVHVSIDDFGIGYSLLGRLNELPFAELKLDRSYVTGCSADPAKRATCQTVCDLAHRFRLTAAAEGVEDADDLRSLVECGYDIAQGYYFAKPMQRADFAAMLMSHGREHAAAAAAPRVA